ncbi:WG repeat-containing protein [Chryseobacterium arthrosphaerae]|uniref:WG repeat-containing protein n=1 Tax=Chryseobacterium arthrosphaerae TaxID=651561 RepID=A0A3S0Q6Z2_9FLAO|nr:WG repeat-containing protein [Chryseobacterium arthrosphaerae]
MTEKVIFYTSLIYSITEQTTSQKGSEVCENGKIGFADRNGKTVIQPRHDFASSFNYGYAVFCDGCDWEKQMMNILQ